MHEAYNGFEKKEQIKILIYYSIIYDAISGSYYKPTHH
jgi:hypothetical protein